jgi:hypothetical protein
VQNQLGRPADLNASPLTSSTPTAPAAALAPVPGSQPNDPRINASTPLTGQADSPRAEKSPAITPAREGAPSTDAANFGTQANYSLPRRDWIVNRYGGPVYVPFDTPDGPPYTYQQYSNAYFPPGIYNNPIAQPMTLQRYLLTPAVPGVPAVAAPAVPNALEQQILDRATTTTPR